MNFNKLIALDYEKFVVELYKGRPEKGCTDLKWLRENYTEDQLTACYIKLHEEHKTMDQEAAVWNDCGDHMDAIWYAGSPKMINEAVAKLKEKK